MLLVTDVNVCKQSCKDKNVEVFVVTSTQAQVKSTQEGAAQRTEPKAKK